MVSMLFYCLLIPLAWAAEAPLPPTYPQGLVSMGDSRLAPTEFFLVDKKARSLRVYSNKNSLPTLVREAPSDMGKKQGDKTRENDKRTPVGIYFLQTQLKPPEIPFEQYGSMAFTTDYPNIFDQRDAKTGHGIWLHSVPDQVPLTRGSRGCVVVRNDVIKDLAKLVKLQETPLVIFDEIKNLSADEYLETKKKFTDFVETWRAAWESEDVDTYIKFYDPEFQNSQMNYKKWYKHKRKLKGRYKSIQVTFSEPLIVWNRDQVVIRFFQDYQSDQHRDFGQKTIHARYSASTGFRIIREDWAPATTPGFWSEIRDSRNLTKTPPTR